LPDSSRRHHRCTNATHPTSKALVPYHAEDILLLSKRSAVGAHSRCKPSIHSEGLLCSSDSTADPHGLHHSFPGGVCACACSDSSSTKRPERGALHESADSAAAAILFPTTDERASSNRSSSGPDPGRSSPSASGEPASGHQVFQLFGRE
jgi:hypothetical protein